MTRSWFTRRPEQHKSRHRGPRLDLEFLEDRTVPATFTVNNNYDDVYPPFYGVVTLRIAIGRANANDGADVIVVPAGVHKIRLEGPGNDTNSVGDFDITDTVTIRGAGAGSTIIDAQGLDRVFDVIGTDASPIKVVFEGLTIRNGDVAGEGGGIRAHDADVVVRDSVVSGNRASLNGGGVAITSAAGDVKLVRSTVSRNVAGSIGGGVYVPGGTLTGISSTIRVNSAVTVGGGIRATTATLTGSRVNGNVAGGSGGGMFATAATLTSCTVGGNVSGGLGGGINAAATAELTSCTVSGNSSVSGGGGVIASEATLAKCTVNRNTTAAHGGGIAAGGVTLTRSTVSGNTAGTSGGGVYAAVAANLTNTTISGNVARAANGGGLLAATGGTLLNCTIVENLAHSGGGVYHSGGGILTLTNTIVALNLVDFAGTSPDVFGTFTSSEHNLIGDGTGGTGLTHGSNGNIVGDGDYPIDPKIGALANNGGPTKTHALLAGSRAIDRGDNTGVPAYDQRGAGFPRIKDGNGDGRAFVDIGAFER